MNENVILATEDTPERMTCLGPEDVAPCKASQITAAISGRST